MLVIDASALVDILTAAPESIPALAKRVQNAEWMMAPELIDYEVLNVLRKMVSRGMIGADFAGVCRLTLHDLRLERYSLTDSMADRVWELRHNASAYDAAYLALAETREVPLITSERRLAEGLRRLARTSIESYAAD
ncbi:type II toxin-antitoxin system VapC family toxin [Saccharomonospora xinjiangensis]|uniref:Putative nucleic acid-binding protein n=1 Tax=Saccharomonospora xinjiangensis XJ-54 TaxID=882086 RepID=I0V444_9PSEU|nr:type II toxin-antitoxin system VapC family toxin [Saccharomonospora xinjiangensis]EID54897.1 putative nucleic acid-binding protein [Saccharomonospora xinjiangensis XJ-54]